MKLNRWRGSVVAFPAERAATYRAEVWGSRTIGDEFHRQAQLSADKPALLTAGRSMTYAELDEATDRIAAGLIEKGFQPGDAVLLQADNSPEIVIAWYALIKAGLIPVTTLSIHRGNEIRQIAEQTQAAGHVVQRYDRTFDLVNFANGLAAENNPPRQVFLLAGDPGEDSLMTVGAYIGRDRARKMVVDRQDTIDPDGVAVFQLSGGTTGIPKVIPRLHAEYWYNSRAWAERLGYEDDVRVLHIMPVVHNAGIVCALHPAHAVGGALVLSSARVDDALERIIEHGVTDVLLNLSFSTSWAEHPHFEEAMKCLRRIVMPGAPFTDQTFDAFESRGVRVFNMFGMGEGLCLATSYDDPRSVRQHSMGYPLSPLDEVRVLEPGTEIEVDDGEPGEFCARGPYTICGYLASPERNAAAFTPSGFYRSGDLVARHKSPTGLTYYTFEGRIKDLVNRGGEKINAAEVENLAGGMPGLRRAALIAIPSERLGESACLCVELESGAEEFTLDMLRAHLDSQEVAKYKWPERLEFFDILPVTPSGKFDKRQLIDLVAQRALADMP
jgi:2,3-dihydroxybenzoate-AMP ligase